MQSDNRLPAKAHHYSFIQTKYVSTKHFMAVPHGQTHYWISYHIGSIPVYPTGYIYVYIYIYHYISLYSSISHWYPTDIPLISQTSMLERARVHKGINCGAAFFCVRAQLVSWDSNLETKRTDSLKGFKRISQWFINKIQENIVTWLYKLKLYMSRCIDRFVSYFYIPHQFWHCNL